MRQRRIKHIITCIIIKSCILSLIIHNTGKTPAQNDNNLSTNVTFGAEEEIFSLTIPSLRSCKVTLPDNIINTCK